MQVLAGSKPFETLNRTLSCLVLFLVGASNIWRALPCCCIAPLSASVVPCTSLPGICLCLLSSTYKNNCHIELGTTLLQWDLILTQDICNDPISKQGHILKS